MLFTSWPFLTAFLPISLAGFWLLGSINPLAARIWLVLVSIVFYGFWDHKLIFLISASICFNYLVSVAIRRTVEAPRTQKTLLLVGIVANILALVYYKYLFSILTFLSGHGLISAPGIAQIVLPLGISFFTFTQIGYLIDCQAGVTKDNNVVDYILFVTFFPHLIAGPIVHNGEMMPQFANRANYGFNASNAAAGLTIFIIGMMKKSMLADPLSAAVARGFDDPGALHIIGSWGVLVSYGVQLYFDFSGYSDMAIGIALMCNIRFPANFNSPFKASNMIDFWQRWHMTLTRYLTQYIYNPMALSLQRRRAASGKKMTRKALESPEAFLPLVAVPLIATMSLAGIWHGAGLQFLIFGALHGLYLTINHAWRIFGPKPPKRVEPRSRLQSIGREINGRALVCLATLVAWVFFRSTDCASAFALVKAMVGLNGIGDQLELPKPLFALIQHLHRFTEPGGLTFLPLSKDDNIQVFYTIVGVLIALTMPNTQQIMARAKPILGALPTEAPRLLLWRPSLPWALAIGGAATLALLSLGGTTEFLYFQF